MTTVQSELPRISDAAARHTVDAAKAFKEFLRVREALKEFEGSMHWKRVEPYEYLVHKKGSKQVYLGPRSSETETRFETFCQQKRKLESRLKTLKETVETSQRINKAVRAGTVPPPVVDVLCALDDAGLGRDSLVVGSPALYAYGQRSGLRVDVIKAPGDTTSVAEEARQQLWVFIDAAEMPTTSKIDKVRQAVKSADITALPMPSSRKVALEVSYGRHAARSNCESTPWHGTGNFWPGRTGLPWPTCSRTGSATPLEEEVLEVLGHAPKFEQVVIGRTGRMAMMRTLDPLVFVTLCERQSSEAVDAPGEAERRKLRVELVSRMLRDYLVTSKLQEAPGEPCLEQLRQLLEPSKRAATGEQTAAQRRAER